MSAKVLCVVVNWNGWSDTRECLESLKKQKGFEFDVALLDNGSSDGSALEMKGYQSNYSCSEFCAVSNVLFFYSLKNEGFAGGVNFVLNRVDVERYEYIWLLNNDAELHEECLSKLYGFAIKNDLSLCSSAIYCKSNQANLESLGVGRHFPYTGRCFLVGKNKKTAFIPDVNKSGYYLSGASLLFKPSILNDVGYLPEEYFMYCEEKCWQFRAKSLGHKIGVSRDSIVYHEGSGSFRNDRSGYYYYISRANVMFERRHYGVLASYSAAIFLFLSAFFSRRNLKEKKMSIVGIIDGLRGVRGSLSRRFSSSEGGR